jgi:hypothetical protein
MESNYCGSCEYFKEVTPRSSDGLCYYSPGYGTPVDRDEKCCEYWEPRGKNV